MPPERLRDAVTGELTLDYFVRRSAEGWRLAGVEWVREASGVSEPLLTGSVLPDATPAPYGLQVQPDALALKENPLETTVLFLILEQIVQERRIGEIAQDLNRRGYSTRSGKPWGPADVFDLMPRLIEIGPALLNSSAWQRRKQARA